MNDRDVPAWVFDLALPDRLVRALVAAVRFAAEGTWHATAEVARALGVTDRTLRSYCHELSDAGILERVGRARYRIAEKREGAEVALGAPQHD